MQLWAPQSWKELSQEQLRMVFRLMWTEDDRVAIKTKMFFLLSGLEVEQKIPGGVRCRVQQGMGTQYVNVMAWQGEQLMHQFDYVDSYEDMGVRLEKVDGLEAVDVDMHGVSFGDWLQIDKHYQAFLHSHEPEMLCGMARFLYRDSEGGIAGHVRLDEAEMACCLFWVGYVKTKFARMFRHFFAPAQGGGNVNFVESMNAQIRALTDGDVTKEQMVFDTDCWRALTELNEKAREAEEFKRKYGD